jgi:acyl-CoA reductase-like NAD-dependent aldehyde dehydrogenase
MSTAAEKVMTSHDVLEVVNPFDLKTIGRVALSDWDAIDKYLEIAHGLFRNRDDWLPTYRRIEILKNAAKLMEERFEPLAF